MKKDLAYYRTLPYRLEVRRLVEEEDGKVYYCASYPRLPRVQGIHQNRLIAVGLAKELFDSYVEAQLAWGEEIPEPDQPRFREPGGLRKFKRTSSVTGSGPGPDSADLPASFGSVPESTQQTLSTSEEPAILV